MRTRPTKYNLAGRMNVMPDRRTIIRKAATEAGRRLGFRFSEEVRDSVGTRAYMMTDWAGRPYCLVAKRRVYVKPEGAFVSADERLVRECGEKGARLVMYLDEGDKFYEFGPHEVLSHPDTYFNSFNMQRMANFPVSLGKNKEAGSK